MYFLNNQNLLEIDDSYHQVFKNPFHVNLALHEIPRMKDAGDLTDLDVKVCKLVHKFTFLDKQRIERLLGVEIKDRLESLVNMRVLNKFVLSNAYEDYPKVHDLDVPDIIKMKNKEILEKDCYILYCLDMAGKVLLEKYTNLDLESWYTSENLIRANAVLKKLILSDFYINIMENTKQYTCEEFNLGRTFYVNKKPLTNDADLAMRLNNHKVNYILLTLRDEDFPQYLRSISERYEILLTTKSWKKYFFEIEESPILLIICENKDLALRVGQFISQCTNIERFRLGVFENIRDKKLSDSGAFYKIEDDKLKKIKAGSFE